jgi:hypothetical protein
LSASKEGILKAIDGSGEIVTFTGDISQEHVASSSYGTIKYKAVTVL